MGISVSLPSDYYLRKFYTQNRQMRLSRDRNGFSNSQLVEADSAALRKAINNIEDIDYDDISRENLYSRVKAYTDTYNNLVDSGADSGSNDVTRKNNKIKTLTREQKEDLKAIGITLKSDGSLKIDSKKFNEASLKNIKKVFSKDNSYLEDVKRSTVQVNRLQKQYNQRSVVSTVNIGGSTTVISEADIISESLTGSNIDLQV